MDHVPVLDSITLRHLNIWFLLPASPSPDTERREMLDAKVDMPFCRARNCRSEIPDTLYIYTVVDNQQKWGPPSYIWLENR